MKIIKKYLDHNFSRRSNGGKIEWIVIHYAGIASAQGSAMLVANSLIARSKTECELSLKRAASTHYVVGDDAVVQLVRDRHRAWHVGAYKETNKCGAENNNSLGVDLVERKLNQKTNSVDDSDWYFSPKVLEEGAKLVAMLANMYHIDLCHIVRHYDVTGKHCPRPMVGKDMNAVTHAQHDELWQRFLTSVADRMEASR